MNPKIVWTKTIILLNLSVPDDINTDEYSEKCFKLEIHTKLSLQKWIKKKYVLFLI